MAKKKVRKKTQRTKTPKEALTAKYLLLCDGVGRQPGTAKVTLYGIFDIIYSPTFPATVGSCHLVAAVRGNGTYGIKLAIVDPNGKDLPGPPEFKMSVSPKSVGVVQLSLAGFQLPKKGRYRFELRTGRRVVASVYVDVQKGPEK